ncbi:crotonase/enoyl-CoA hydratase family protein [Kibdelosporangium phytohabitans]|uniref:crotonase/enoyl-CoA hydratase family protein n=1 Tax=Kibdelosporangium phytohabitans TaxID=860235 RepID=UPI001A0933AF|nr:crotonase/enoyl-CoA hydratase family protein [Kibdelosporangium phytohabitans]MBE1461930.1 enoyl-CoA hydratase/carnithine racemase [Kibdelosporangium phytohabitans]
MLLIGLNRPEERNSFESTMLDGLADAYGRLEDDPDAWVGVLFAHGDHFTAGLDLAQVAGRIGSEGGLRHDCGAAIDPWGLVGRERSKPLVAAAQGWCLTLGIELLLASDIRVAADDTRFSQLEVKRGIYPFGGATIRFPREAGWGNAMRWLLTGDEFGPDEALRLGLVQEVVPAGTQLDRAVELAERITDQAAPLGVRLTLASARRAVTEGHQAAADRLVPDLLPLFGSEDAAEGVRSFVERRAARFVGR